jgi:hypothetical protein
VGLIISLILAAFVLPLLAAYVIVRAALALFAVIFTLSFALADLLLPRRASQC